jgi:hypothetical protein
VDVKALRDAGLVDVTITAPEIESARSSSWSDGYRVARGIELPALATGQRMLGSTARASTEAYLTAEAAGYYRVVARARSVNGPVRTSLGVPIDRTAVAEVWLWIDETGGKITATFDASLFPDTLIAQPGPFRKRTRVNSGASTASSAMRTPGNRTWEILYYNSDASSYDPLVGAKVVGEEGLAGDPTTPISDVTDNDGKFVTGCDHDLIYYWEFDVKVENVYFRVTPGTAVASQSGTSPSGCSAQQLIATSAQSHLFTNLRITGTEALDIFDEATTVIAVNYDSGAGSSYYTIGGDSITMHVVWGNTAAEAAAHEFGHAFHDNTLGGIEPNRPNCSSHGTPVYTSQECAYSEGFAEFFAAVTRPEVTSEDDDFESNVDLLLNSNPNGSDPNDPNGTLIEGAVAAFLWDLHDSVVEAHDSTAYPGSYLADLISTCSVDFGSGSQHANGVDMLIRCAEKSTDSSVSSYFYPRDTNPTSYSESATEPGSWSASHIRLNWKKNLYNQ